MTTTVREPDERIHLQQGAILLQDQILGYIAYRGSMSHSYVDMSRDMNMTDGWVGEIANARIKVMKLDTRKKVSAALSQKYGAEGIPILHARPVTVPAPEPRAALHRGFGPKGGDPSRPLAPVKEPTPIGPSVEDPSTEEAVGFQSVSEMLDMAEDIMELVRDKTRAELAEMYLKQQEELTEARLALGRKEGEYNQLVSRLTTMSSQLTQMDNTRIRLGAEIVERDRTIKGQAEDMEEYEKTMDILQQRVDDLQGFKDGVVTQLRQFAVLLWQVVPPDMQPQVQTSYRAAGTQTGRFSSAFDNPANRPRIDEELGPFGEFASGRLPSDGSDPHAKRDALDMG